MKRAVAIAVLALTPSLSRAAEPSLFGLEVSMKPGAQAGVYLCEALVKNLESGEVFSAPRISFGAGVPATAKTSSGNVVSILTVSVDAAAGVGTAQLTVSKAGKLVAAQKSSLRLK